MLSPFLLQDLALPLAFIFGSGYPLWPARSIYTLRQARANFRLAIMLLGMVFAIATGLSVLGIAQAALEESL